MTKSSRRLYKSECDKIKKKRKQYGLSLRAMGELVGVTHSYMCKIEKGDIAVSKAVLNSIEYVFSTFKKGRWFRPNFKAKPFASLYRIEGSIVAYAASYAGCGDDPTTHECENIIETEMKTNGTHAIAINKITKIESDSEIPARYKKTIPWPLDGSSDGCPEIELGKFCSWAMQDFYDPE